SEFSLYEDDGESMSYLGGEYAETRMVSDLEGSAWTFTINERHGSYDTGRESVIVIAHAVNSVDAVAKNGDSLTEYSTLFEMHQQTEGWFYDIAERKLYVKIPDTAQETQLSVEIDNGLMVEWIGSTYTWPAQSGLKATDDLWINTESYPQGAGVNSIVVYSSDGGETWAVEDMELAGQHDANDWWHANLGTFSAGTVIEYAVAVIDDDGRYTWDSNSGNNYSIPVNTVQPVLWHGNTHYWPWAGEIDPEDDFWVNIESYPMGAAVSAKVVYTADGENWQVVDMGLAGQNGNNDWWHVSLGQFPSGTHIRFAVVVQDGNATDFWDSNDGADYHADVN
ncbi:MAG: DUF5110 domain-containing protein, partial [Verrucomicrobia bacterium]|nr:DUF5110 domain-containing protein [Verrucomicrobiota bacterium]